jgi:hypothetical protein
MGFNEHQDSGLSLLSGSLACHSFLRLRRIMSLITLTEGLRDD